MSYSHLPPLPATGLSINPSPQHLCLGCSLQAKRRGHGCHSWWLCPHAQALQCHGGDTHSPQPWRGTWSCLLCYREVGTGQGPPSALRAPSLPAGCLQNVTLAGACWGKDPLLVSPALIFGITCPEGQCSCKRRSPLITPCRRPESRAKPPGSTRGSLAAALGLPPGAGGRAKPEARTKAQAAARHSPNGREPLQITGHAAPRVLATPSPGAGGQPGCSLPTASPAGIRWGHGHSSTPPQLQAWPMGGRCGPQPCLPPSPKTTPTFYAPFIDRNLTLKKQLGASTDRWSTAPAPGAPRPPRQAARNRPVQSLAQLLLSLGCCRMGAQLCWGLAHGQGCP